MRSRHRNKWLADLNATNEACQSNLVRNRRSQETRPRPNIQHSLTGARSKRLQELRTLCNDVGRKVYGEQTLCSSLIVLESAHILPGDFGDGLSLTPVPPNGDSHTVCYQPAEQRFSPVAKGKTSSFAGLSQDRREPVRKIIGNYLRGLLGAELWAQYTAAAASPARWQVSIQMWTPSYSSCTGNKCAGMQT